MFLFTDIKLNKLRMANKYIAKKNILPKYSYSELEIFQKKAHKSDPKNE